MPTPASSPQPFSNKPEPHTTRSSGQESAAWQLIRDDVFDRIVDDAELTELVAERAKMSDEPHAELIRLMLGMSLPEDEAHAMLDRIVEHRRQMVRALERPVHVRVAALDFLMTRPSHRRSPRDSRPIMVAPSLLERALEEAGSDGVTGLPRSPHFMGLLSHELLQRRRRVVVAFLDLDGFKRVNDEHGHTCGDDVLRTMAEAARTVLRRGDVVARLGGDEFGLMLVDVSLEEAVAAIDRLRSRFEDLTSPLATSFSAGLVFAEPGASAEDLVKQADRAMYEEKRQRRARCRSITE